MMVVLLVDLSQHWAQELRKRLAHPAEGFPSAVILDGADPARTLELLGSVPADIVITQMLSLTSLGIAALEQMRSQAPEAVFVCIAPKEVSEKVRADELPAPDLWLRPSDSQAAWDTMIGHAVDKAALRAEQMELAGAVARRGRASARPAQRPEPAPQTEAPAIDVFRRLMSGFTGGFDLDHLWNAYVDAATQFVQCATYCLLWERTVASNGRNDSRESRVASKGKGEGRESLLATHDSQPATACYTVYAERGVPAEIAESAKLLSTDALPTWCRRNRRVVTAAELPDWPDRPTAVAVKRELDLFCGQVAVPLIVRGRLAGIIIIGEKVLGEGYSAGELQTLFAMSNYVSLAAESIELHQELERAKAYTDRIVQAMSAGLITLGPEERISLCNPYAAQVLGLEQDEVEGADLRALPSPLGDYLYAALQSADNAISAQEVSIQGGKLALRVSTSALVDDAGNILGSVMLLDDVTAEVELTRERSRSERLGVLTRIVGRIAHEVKNPLTAVKTYAELIGERGPDKDLAQFWSRTVTPEIDHLDELLNNLVRMVEQPEPNLQPARIEDLITEAVSQITHRENQGQSPEVTVPPTLFEVEIAEDLPAVSVDPRPTRDALGYLLRYVAGLAGTEPFRVHIRAARGSQDGSAVQVTMQRVSGVSATTGSFEPDAIFDPLYVMEHPEADLRPVIGQKIITSQHGSVEAGCENGRVTMSVLLPTTSD